ncbi:DUF2617 family protein [Actinomycetes bacterium KLBMP 9797]
MLVRLDVPYADSTAGDLSFALGLPVLPALHTLRLSATLELRLLGASHQVVAGDLVETVACLPGRAPHLPPSVDDPGYRFAATVERLDRTVAAALWRDLVRDPRALVGVFPGDPDAVTALRADDHGWQTWHAYPQTGELVVTRTVLEA